MKRRFLSSLLACVLLPELAHASHEDVALSARSMGMADAVTAVPGEMGSWVFNPATLGQVRRSQIEAGARRLFEIPAGIKDMNGMAGGIALPLQDAPIGGALSVWGFYDEIAKVSLDRTAALTYATRSWREFEGGNLDLGMTLKYLSRSGRSVAGSSSRIAVDLGSLISLGDDKAIGVSLLNANGPRTDLGPLPDRAPVILRAGYAQIFRAFKMAMDVAKREPSRGFNATTSGAIGTEYEWGTAQHGTLAARAGLNLTGLTRALSLGAGWRVLGMHLDYALRIPMSGESRFSHAVGLSYLFGTWNPETEYERLLSSEFKYRQDLSHQLEAAEARENGLSQELARLKAELDALRKQLADKSEETGDLRQRLRLKELEDRRLKAQKNLEELQKERDKLRRENKQALYREDWAAYRKLKEQGVSEHLLIERVKEILSQYQGTGVDLGEANQELQRLMRQ